MNPWSRPDTVEGFVASPPNPTLIDFAARELERTRPGAVALDIGCGAARNAWPLAEHGWNVLGLDTSRPMLEAAHRRAGVPTRGSLWFALAPLDRFPVATGSIDLLIAHGIWNLASSSREFREGLAEAARVARPGAGLFLFTFSRNTLAADAQPVEGETFVYTQFAGRPQCFLTKEQILRELGEAGFEPDAAVPLRELNRRPQGMQTVSSVPVIFEGAFRYSRS